MKIFHNINEIIKLKSNEINDVVIFMAAYSVNKFKKQIKFIRNKQKFWTLLNQFHITGFSNGNAYITANEIIKYKAKYDNISKAVSFNFEKSIDGIEKDVTRDMFILLSIQKSIVEMGLTEELAATGIYWLHGIEKHSFA